MKINIELGYETIFRVIDFGEPKDTSMNVVIFDELHGASHDCLLDHFCTNFLVGELVAIKKSLSNDD